MSKRKNTICFESHRLSTRVSYLAVVKDSIDIPIRLNKASQLRFFKDWGVLKYVNLNAFRVQNIALSCSVTVVTTDLNEAINIHVFIK